MTGTDTDWESHARGWEARAKQNARQAARYRLRLRAAETEPSWVTRILARLDRIEELLEDTEWDTEPQPTQQPTTEGTNHE